MDLLIKHKILFFCLSFMIVSMGAKLYSQEQDREEFLEDQKEFFDLKDALFIKSIDYFAYKDISPFVQYDRDNKAVTINLSSMQCQNLRLEFQTIFDRKDRTAKSLFLQYRLSDNEPWKELNTLQGDQIEFTPTRKDNFKAFNINLPKNLENQSFIQIRFVVKSNNPKLWCKVQNLRIQSEFDPYAGKAEQINIYNSSDSVLVFCSFVQKSIVKQTKSLNFNKIALPYAFGLTKRLDIETKYIRDTIKLSIQGEDSKYFSVSPDYLISGEKQKSQLLVRYSPKQAGKHNAKLVLQLSPSNKIAIDLNGSCAKKKDLLSNLLPENTSISKNVKYYIPIFSSTKYEFRFSCTQSQNTIAQIQSKDTLKPNTLLNPVYVKYDWYAGEDKLFSMYDTLKSNDYCVNILTPNLSTRLVINIESDKKFSLSNYYFGSPLCKRMIHSGVFSDSDNWEAKRLPNIEDIVFIDPRIKATIDKDAMCSVMILGDSSNVVIQKGRSFYVGDYIEYGKNAWFTVKGELLGGQWNYICSPINKASGGIFSSTNNQKQSQNNTWLMYYNTGNKSLQDDYWSEYITDPNYNLVPAKGYAVYSHEKKDVFYEGLLCDRQINIPLKYTEQDKWNFIGNPYTNSLSSKKLYSSIEGKIQGNTLQMYSPKTKQYNPIIIDDKQEVVIPELESFFVEALTDNQTITFSRSQQYINIKDKDNIDKTKNYNYLSLSIGKNELMQYALLGMDSNSTYGFDSYDCHKLYGINSTMAEIFLRKDNEDMSVCVFPNYPAIYDIGLYISEPADMELNINNLGVLPEGVRLFIEDKQTQEFQDFCSNGNMEISLDKGETMRYRLHIIKNIELPKERNANSNIYLWQDNSRIILYCEQNNLNFEITNIKDKNFEPLTIKPKAFEPICLNLPKGWYLIQYIFAGKPYQEIIEL